MTAAWAELHIHIEGTLEPAMIFDRARANKIDLIDPDEASLSRRYQFRDLQSFLDLYYENMRVLRTEDDFFEMTAAYLRRAKRAAIGHVELFVDPQAHSKRGIPAAVVLRGVSRALQWAEANLGISGGIIACVLRDEPVTAADAMLDEVLETGIPILGLGLDSAEVGYPPSQFVRTFDRARAAGLHVVAHAGEDGEPDYVWQALDMLGAERIDHGIRALEDESLVKRLVADAIPLTVCPLSNVRLRAVRSIEDHPLPRMLALGMKVTINSDDPAYFGGYLEDNVRAVQAAFDLSEDQIQTLALNSIDASFISDSERGRLRAGVA
ncbi:MAG: putative adenosine deaminase [Frondihabitans sp.]|nr:putative adenosine deaminase [Frondihabitans sp.]